jgi:hypothetical protein
VVSLASGSRLGPYEIVAPLGQGGMGEVYRARDTKLGREVALKVLPASLADDGERRARFEREARTLAALNHPHIAQVYGFEERAPTVGAPALGALVMELVAGESLAARIARGPVPLREALELAQQIAEGLEAAHEKGIVHRDLKPANVQVTPDGQAKILDFGLAKAVAPAWRGRPPADGPAAAGPRGILTASDDAPTLTSPAQMTQAGIVLGTAAYMSPEQARGVAVDARTDVWAFGALLYELLSGARPFQGPSVTDTLAQILERDPDWTKLPVTTPGTVRALIQRCLRKTPKQRLHDIADARFAIEDALGVLSAGASGEGQGASGIGAQAPQRPARAIWRHPLPIGLACASLALGAALAWSVTRTPEASPREPQFVSLMLPPDQEMGQGGVALSPDGRDLVYSAFAEDGPPGPEGDVIRLYHRRLSAPTARVLPGTDYPYAPNFSPDGAWVAFYARADQKLRKIALGGGGALTIADAPWFTWAPEIAWSDTGHLLLADNFGPVRRIPAAGGVAEVVVPRSALQGREQGTYTPWALPGDAGILFSTRGATGGAVAVWAGGQRRDLPVGDLLATTLFGPWLLGWRSVNAAQTDLVAASFDRARGEVRGEARAVLTEGGGAFTPLALSATGTLAYRATRVGAHVRRFTWLAFGDHTLRPPPMDVRGTPMAARLSPDGRLVAYGQGDPNRLVVADLGTGLTRVVASVAGPVAWTPDGRRLIHQIRPDEPGGAGLQWKPVDGSAPAERLTTGKVWQQPQVVTRDGRFLVYQEAGGLSTRQGETEDNYDLWLLPLAPRGAPRPLLKTPANERLAHVSPDGKWMAYVSDQGGRDEIWVRAFPEGAADIQVSQEGGTEPVWAPDGGTLYYRDRTGSRISAVPVTMGSVPQFGAPVVRVGNYHPGLTWTRSYDIRPDGRALLLLPGITLGREITLVLNFDEVIRRKMAEGSPR